MKITGSKAFAAVAAALLLTACSSTVDSAELEEEIKTKIAAEVGEESKGVECPEDLEVKKDETFSCTLTTLEDEEIELTGTWTDDDGNFSIEG